MKKLLLLFILFSWTHTAFAGFDEGWDAYEKGDYKDAFREWKDFVGEDNLFSDYDFNPDEPKAPTVHSQAQYNLGFMYENGQGTLKNYAEAYKYYNRSAKQNYSLAQLALVRLLLRYVDGDLKHMLTAEQKGTLREGWQEIAKNVMLLFNNKHASSKNREAAEDNWNKYKLWNYPY